MRKHRRALLSIHVRDVLHSTSAVFGVLNTQIGIGMIIGTQFLTRFARHIPQQNLEIWFARIEREVIARGVFTTVRDLARKLMRYVRAYSKTARPFKWKYSTTAKGISCESMRSWWPPAARSCRMPR